jgi:hypothetical protein
MKVKLISVDLQSSAIGIATGCGLDDRGVGVGAPLHLWTETDPVSETLCFLVYRIPDDGQSPETQ